MQFDMAFQHASLIQVNASSRLRQIRTRQFRVSAEIQVAICSVETPNRKCGPVPEPNDFIKAELDRRREAFSGLGRPDMLESPELENRLNGIFRETISEAVALRG